ncbi:MAG: hypothetical protein IPI55_04425 [Flavobacteriales bacterium]|nr:hypothetical protein [Flavobacteriales bacterium]
MRLSTIIIALFVCAIAPVHAQQSAPAAPAPHTWYFASGGEWILSYALLDVKGDDKGSIPRFSPFFNLQRVANYDVNEHFGFFVGLSLRNVGFIYDVPDTTLRYKFRTYSLGLPVGFKVGTMGKGLLFVGYNWNCRSTTRRNVSRTRRRGGQVQCVVQRCATSRSSTL